MQFSYHSAISEQKNEKNEKNRKLGPGPLKYKYSDALTK